MKSLWFFGGLLVGAGLAFRLRPASEASCCARVAAGARDEAGSACGPFGSACQAIGDALEVWDQVPSLLDAFGVAP